MEKAWIVTTCLKHKMLWCVAKIPNAIETNNERVN